MKRTKKERQSSFENCRSFLERATGIEPASSAWEADILPMNYICIIVIAYRQTAVQAQRCTVSDFLHCSVYIQYIIPEKNCKFFRVCNFPESVPKSRHPTFPETSPPARRCGKLPAEAPDPLFWPLSGGRCRCRLPGGARSHALQ